MSTPLRGLAIAITGIFLAGNSQALDIDVRAFKLIVVDKLAVSANAKAVFVAKDPEITKGTGLDPDLIDLRLDVAYSDGSAVGAFVVPAGPAAGWRFNKETVAKYVNVDAPGGATVSKLAIVKPGNALKLVAKGLGDTPLDILGQGPPAFGVVYTSFGVENAGERNYHCSEFTGCTWRLIAGGTGAKLRCSRTRDGAPFCRARCGATLGHRFVDLGATVLDSCTNLEWEKKVDDPADLHFVNEPVAWAGRCTLASSVLCQPNATAAATCVSQTGGAPGCAECGVGEGSCEVPFPSPGIRTVWEWLNEVNASAFVGHTDWRLATVERDGNPAELETLLEVAGCIHVQQSCIAAVFGPTDWREYWSSVSFSGDDAWVLQPNALARVQPFGKDVGRRVRAVRAAP